MRIRTIGFLMLAMFSSLGSFAVARGQSAPAGLRGPVIGYVLDAGAQFIRPVNGIPGSSVLGEPLDLPFPVAAAAFSPQGNFALVAGADGTATLLRGIGSENRIEPIEGTITAATSVVFNGDGSAAALIASGSRQLQIVHGLFGSPTAGPVIDLSSIPETISAVAIDQAGSTVLIAVASDHGALYLATEQEDRLQFIANFGSPAALKLTNGDADVIVADSATNEVSLVHNFATEPETFRLLSERDGISGPAGLQLSADGRRLYIADRTSRTLDIWNFDAQSIEASYRLDAEPTGITALQGYSTFVLNEVGDHPLLLLDAVNRATYFVPAGKERN